MRGNGKDIDNIGVGMKTYTVIDKNTVKEEDIIDVRAIKTRISDIDAELENANRLPEMVTVKNAERDGLINNLVQEKNCLLNQLTIYGNNV
jgi:hypothetical protein